jgi:uncharacterized protein YcfJ
MAIATQATAQVVFYEYEGFGGRTFSADRPVVNFEEYGFNDRASAVVVLRDRWEVCSDAGFGGACIVLRAGRYPSLAAMNMGNRISSARIVAPAVRIEEPRYAPPSPEPVYDNRRRYRERLFEAPVTSVRAVVRAAEQRCWVEHDYRGDGRGAYNQGQYQQGQNQSSFVQQADANANANARANANVPGAVAGALIGGVLGHQVGNGRGKDVATAIGVFTGAAIGANAGNNNNVYVNPDEKRGSVYEGRGEVRYGRQQEIRRCVTEQPSAPDYWDVTYNFRGQEHRMQMTTPPGPTVIVNRAGEPRSEQ